ncbi:MAG TPA: hypothetical protein HA252_05780 [Candidatus Diapherotrites archaeon]|uniref:Uncharacterized protein n=1 Tax=Candidatus Iainarchaeum sp. TaxID=3101447 RepID=A0A7J4JLW3_9ARCH|nr:hypothetical protein [Candidatus Diapherotrites archaeon]HIH16887.1 hypothetical protein [Candidatus Diapherotrites archaeon]
MVARKYGLDPQRLDTLEKRLQRKERKAASRSLADPKVRARLKVTLARLHRLRVLKQAREWLVHYPNTLNAGHGFRSREPGYQLGLALAEEQERVRQKTGLALTSAEIERFLKQPGQAERVQQWWDHEVPLKSLAEIGSFGDVGNLGRKVAQITNQIILQIATQRKLPLRAVVSHIVRRVFLID